MIGHERFISHPLLKEKKLQSRTYQEVIAARASKANTMCVLPTGLGKTAVAILLTLNRLEKYPEKKVLVMAPTRPLVDQHLKSFRKVINLEEEKFVAVTGKTPPAERARLYKNTQLKLIFATPQCIEKDIISKRIDLSEFTLMVFDECHRAIGNYPYVFIAEHYIHTKPEEPKLKLILGLTASPGGDERKIKEVAENLYIKEFEIRTEKHLDVGPYVKPTRLEWVSVPLTKHFERVKTHLENAYKARLKELKSLGIITSVTRVNKADLLKMRGKIGSKLSQSNDPGLFKSIALVAQCIKIQHALELLETQGIAPLYNYFSKLKKEYSKNTRALLNDPNVNNAVAVAGWMYTNNMEHPKIYKLMELVKGLKGKAIIFTQYRSTVDLIAESLKEHRVEKFKGQREGFTQKKQLEVLEKFKKGEFDIMVSTSIGEEGLDIPEVDYVIFYEPIPSEIRSIQRRGRTGRHKAGKVIVLVAEKTRDEAYRWRAYHREKKMRDTIENIGDLKAEMKKQKTLDSFRGENRKNQIIIYVDDREHSILKELSKKDIVVRPKRLPVADFLISDRAAVEKKTARDFVNSILDQRLFNQLSALKSQFEKAILIVEGLDLFSHREVHPNAIRGALSSIALDYNLPILWTANQESTAELLVALARKEQEDNKRPIAIRGERYPKNMDEQQKYLIAGLPNISTIMSERLLKEFGNPLNVFNAPESKLKKVRGLGEEKIKRIKYLLTRKYLGV